MCRAELGAGRRYRVLAPEPVGPLESLLDRLAAAAGGRGRVLAGFDFPIGLPAAYAARAGVRDFRAALRRFGRGRWARFYDVAERAEEISLTRPFYPRRPGATTRRQLALGFGLAGFDQLMRPCDRATSQRPAGSAIFWTLGAQQVGKAAIVGWRDLLAPALRSGRHRLMIWPFDGTLAACLAGGRLVVAEAYPAEFYGHLGLRAGRRWSKRVQADRARHAAALSAYARRADLTLARPLGDALADGFGAGADGEDRFDAVIGTLGMLGVVLGLRPPGDPKDALTRRLEGWILGQTEGTRDPP